MANQTLLWAVLVVLLMSLSAASMEPQPAVQAGTQFEHTRRALSDITRNLEVVASEGEVVAEDCERQIESVNDTLTWITSQLPSIPLDESADFFRSAAKAVSACSTYLSVRADSLPALVYHKSRKALSTVHQMLTQLSTDCELVIAEKSNQINKTSNLVKDKTHFNNTVKVVNPSDDGDEGFQGCGTVNPTTCQFSACGQGRRLPLCAFGFADGVTGGLKGKSYVVTNNEDDHAKPSPGSLRYGVHQGGQANGGIWITFAGSFVITLTDLLWIKSGTTIDGRGYNVTVTGKSMVLCGVSNVILHNFQISTVGESDTVHIYAGSSRIWVDHLTSSDAKLGLASVLQGSTDVTISNSHLSNYNFNMLLGASDFDKQDMDMRVSVYRNWFKDSMQRMPHCRWGKCHVLNNLYSNWGYYALGARVSGKIYSESNAFVASRRTEITPWFNGIGTNYDRSIYIRSSRDVLLNGSTLHEFLSPESAVHDVEEQGAIYKNDKMYPSVIPPANLHKLIPPCVGAVFGWRLQQCTYT